MAALLVPILVAKKRRQRLRIESRLDNWTHDDADAWLRKQKSRQGRVRGFSRGGMSATEKQSETEGSFCTRHLERVTQGGVLLVAETVDGLWRKRQLALMPVLSQFPRVLQDTRVVTRRDRHASQSPSGQPTQSSQHGHFSLDATVLCGSDL